MQKTLNLHLEEMGNKALLLIFDSSLLSRAEKALKKVDHRLWPLTKNCLSRCDVFSMFNAE